MYLITIANTVFFSTVLVLYEKVEEAIIKTIECARGQIY